MSDVDDDRSPEEAQEAAHVDDGTKPGHTVALPPTQEDAREALYALADEAHWAVTDEDDGTCACAAVDAVLSAPPEVIAAAMGGTTKTEYRVFGYRWNAEHMESEIDERRCTVIVLPPRGDEQ